MDVDEMQGLNDLNQLENLQNKVDIDKNENKTYNFTTMNNQTQDNDENEFLNADSSNELNIRNNKNDNQHLFTSQNTLEEDEDLIHDNINKDETTSRKNGANSGLVVEDTDTDDNITDTEELSNEVKQQKSNTNGYKINDSIRDESEIIADTIAFDDVLSSTKIDKKILTSSETLIEQNEAVQQQLTKETIENEETILVDQNKLNFQQIEIINENVLEANNENKLIIADTQEPTENETIKDEIKAEIKNIGKEIEELKETIELEEKSKEVVKDKAINSLDIEEEKTEIDNKDAKEADKESLDELEKEKEPNEKEENELNNTQLSEKLVPIALIAAESNEVKEAEDTFGNIKTDNNIDTIMSTPAKIEINTPSSVITSETFRFGTDQAIFESKHLDETVNEASNINQFEETKPKRGRKKKVVEITTSTTQVKETRSTRSNARKSSTLKTNENILEEEVAKTAEQANEEMKKVDEIDTKSTETTKRTSLRARKSILPEPQITVTKTRRSVIKANDNEKPEQKVKETRGRKKKYVETKEDVAPQEIEVEEAPSKSKRKYTRKSLASKTSSVPDDEEITEEPRTKISKKSSTTTATTNKRKAKKESTAHELENEVNSSDKKVKLLNKTVLIEKKSTIESRGRTKPNTEQDPKPVEHSSTTASTTTTTTNDDTTDKKYTTEHQEKEEDEAVLNKKPPRTKLLKQRKSVSTSSSTQSFSTRQSNRNAKSTNSSVKVMTTGILLSDKEQKFVGNLGGEIVTDVKQCTHLITNKIIKSCKFLCCLSRGINIVNERWLEESNRNKMFLNASAYLLQDAHCEKQYKFSLQTSLLKARSTPLLQDWKFLIEHKDFPTSELTVNDLTQMVECAGGEVINDLKQTIEDKSLENIQIAILFSDEDKLNQFNQTIDNENVNLVKITIDSFLNSLLKQQFPL